MTASAQPTAFELSDVVKDYAVDVRGFRLRAVDHLSLTVTMGQVFGLLGPNGSGKSTVLKLLLGLITPTSGQCRILGQPGSENEVRRRIGYAPESPHFPSRLTGREMVCFHGRLCGLGGRPLAEAATSVLERVGLRIAADRRVETYSKGMLQRLGLAQALVHAPELLILDEPLAGVDPVGAALIGGLILQLRQEGKTILMTSHHLAQVEEICDAVAILNRGRLVFESRLNELSGDDRPLARRSRLEEIYLARVSAFNA